MQLNKTEIESIAAALRLAYAAPRARVLLVKPCQEYALAERVKFNLSKTYRNFLAGWRLWCDFDPTLCIIVFCIKPVGNLPAGAQELDFVGTQPLRGEQQ